MLRVAQDLMAHKLVFIETVDVVETTLALDNFRRACDCGRGAIFFSVARGKVRPPPGLALRASGRLTSAPVLALLASRHLATAPGRLPSPSATPMVQTGRSVHKDHSRHDSGMGELQRSSC